MKAANATVAAMIQGLTLGLQFSSATSLGSAVAVAAAIRGSNPLLVVRYEADVQVYQIIICDKKLDAAEVPREAKMSWCPSSAVKRTASLIFTSSG